MPVVPVECVPGAWVLRAGLLCWVGVLQLQLNLWFGMAVDFGNCHQVVSDL